MKKNTLFDNYINDSLTDSEYEELMEKLQDDEIAEKFTNYLIETQLILNAASNITSVAPSVAPEIKETTFKTVSWKILFLAASIILGLFLLIPQKQQFEVIASTSSTFKSGQFINNKVIALDDGTVKFKLPDNSIIELKSPARLIALSKHQLELTKGSLNVHLAPNVKSFEVTTAFGTVEDLGTAFGIHLTKSSALLSVYDGKVRLKLKNNSKEFTVGEAVTFNEKEFQKAIFTEDVFEAQDISLFGLGHRQLRPGQNMELNLDKSAQSIQTQISMSFDRDKDFKYQLVATSQGKIIYESSAHTAKDEFGINIPVNNLDNVQITFKALEGSIQNAILKMQNMQLLTKGSRPYEGDFLIPPSSEWSYFFEKQPEANWLQLTYDDNQWPKGQASIGYGDYDLKTKIGPDSLRKTISRIYLRKVFDLDNIELADMQKLNLNLLADDGAVIYLNGRDILRHNLTDGPINEETHALNRAVKHSGEIIYSNYSLPVDSLSQGKNVISAILYQVGKKSSDMRFDLQLKVY